jgi:hypothetical protein
MQLPNGRNGCLIEPESCPTNDLNITHFTVSANIDCDVYGCFRIRARRGLRIFGPQASIWPWQAQSLNLRGFFIFRRILDQRDSRGCQCSSLNNFVFVSFSNDFDQTVNQTIAVKIF